MFTRYVQEYQTEMSNYYSFQNGCSSSESIGILPQKYNTGRGFEKESNESSTISRMQNQMLALENQMLALHSTVSQHCEKIDNFIEKGIQPLVEKLFQSNVVEFYKEKEVADYLIAEQEVKGSKSFTTSSIANLVRTRAELLLGRDAIYKYFKDLEILRFIFLLNNVITRHLIQ